MLTLRPNCEHCKKALPNTSTEAMICSYECTYCKSCAIDLFKNVCPSCGGNFEKRPIRPKEEIKINPASNLMIHKPKNKASYEAMIKKFQQIEPKKR